VRILNERTIKIEQSLDKEELEMMKEKQKNDQDFQKKLQKKKNKRYLRLFVGNLHKSVEEGDIISFFKEFEIDFIEIKKNEKGQSRGFGFVQFKDEVSINQVFTL
jgi:RNA recognition motif-containing protein